MTGPTHRKFSVCFAYLASMLLYKYNISMINYYLVIMIMLMASKVGALFPDLDHAWCNIHDKTVVNKIINTLIHITGGKHRSWQTHSIDIWFYFTTFAYIFPQILYNKKMVTLVNKEVAIIIMLGFASGWASHLVSDMLTSSGVRLICFIKFKVAVVPKKIGKFRFNTGNEWEAFIFKLIQYINIGLGLICVIYPVLPQIIAYIK